MREAVRIRLARKEYLLRPTFDAYGEIEARHGPLRTVYTAVVTGTATLAVMASIVGIGARQVDGQADDWGDDAIAQRLYEAGAWSEEVILPIGEFVAALGWTPEQRKKHEAAGADDQRAAPSA